VHGVVTPSQPAGPEVAQELDEHEASRRLEQYGPNEIPEPRRHPLLELLSFFWGPIPWMIEIAAALSALARHWADFVVIVVLLLMNAAVGFWEEYQAGNAVAALKKRLAPSARVRRSGRWRVIPARELVPGDRIQLRSGDIVPADARLVGAGLVELDQSALTGESLPVERRGGEGVFSGSIVRRGESEALVTATGAGTYFGRTASLVAKAQAPGHLQQAILDIGRYLILLALALVALIVVTSLARHESFLAIVEFALVLTVAAVPVALPAVLSVTMAVGSRLLARKEAVVTRLSAIDELAGIDLLCADKTGTLTRNQLTLGEPVVFAGTREELLAAAALASREADQDPIDLAVLGTLHAPQLDEHYRVTGFVPFDPVRKRTEATVESADGSTFFVAKGAPQVIGELAGPGAEVAARIEAAVQAFASRGFRSLGVARADAPGQWRVLGVLPLFDPARPDAAETVAAARQLGIQVKMVTGDQLAIAREIASQVGLGTNILDARILGESQGLASEQLAATVEAADGFAQVFPEHKYRLVELLQGRGHIVGMTGDGVNDAPALKKADVGIAVSGATDTARAAAAIVLLGAGLAVIVDAIRESRRIFERMSSYARYRISETVRVLLFMTLSILVFRFYPVTAVMIVLLALLNDAAILSISYDRVEPAPQPQTWDLHTVLPVATVLGTAGVISSFLLLYLAERRFHVDHESLRSLVYLKLSLAGHLTIFVVRTRGRLWSVRPAWILLGAVLGTQLLATAIAVGGFLMKPIPITWALAVWGYALAWMLVNDQVKLATYWVLERRKASGPAHAGGAGT
jgi:H+-transporting ATPase